MKRKQALYLLIAIIAMVFSSCTGKAKYSPPTISEVNNFIAKNSINELSTKLTKDFAIVLFGNGQERGHYVLYKDQKNEIYSQWVKSFGNSKEHPVSLGGVASGKTPFVTVIINDEEISEKAEEVEITFEDGAVVKERISGKGTIVLYESKLNNEPMSYRKLIIYGKDMTKLYEK